MDKRDLKKLAFKYTKPKHWKSIHLFTSKEMRQAALRQKPVRAIAGTVGKLVEFSGKKRGLSPKEIKNEKFKATSAFMRAGHNQLNVQFGDDLAGTIFHTPGKGRSIGLSKSH